MCVFYVFVQCHLFGILSMNIVKRLELFSRLSAISSFHYYYLLLNTLYKVCVALHFNVWDRNLGDESRGVSEAVSHREKNAENDLWSDIEG